MPAGAAGLGMPIWAVGAIMGLLLTAGASDWRSGRIPNWLTYPAILLGLVGNTLEGWSGQAGPLAGLLRALLGFAVGFLPLMLAWLAGGVGGGDAKLMGGIGAIGGWEFALGAMLYGFVIAAVMAVIVMVRRRVVRRTLRRLWLMLVLLVTPGARAGDAVDKDSPRIPFGVALCAGTLGAIAELMLRAAGR